MFQSNRVREFRTTQHVVHINLFLHMSIHINIAHQNEPGDEQAVRRFSPFSGMWEMLPFVSLFVWLLAYPFEGGVLYAILERDTLLPRDFVFEGMIVHLLGLLSAGALIRNCRTARLAVRLSLGLCLAATLCSFFPTQGLRPVLLAATFFSGICVAAWGYYLKRIESKKVRFYAVADMLIYSNIGMAIVNTITVSFSLSTSLVMLILILCFGFLFSFKKPETQYGLEDKPSQIQKNMSQSLLPVLLFSVFITVLAVNSGFMYQVFMPSFNINFEHSRCYLAIPYVVFVYIMRTQRESFKTITILFAALGMIGFAFLAFFTLDRNLPSYLLVITLILGAYGIYDMFWWGVLSAMLSKYSNAAMVIGIGMSGNVLGIILGGKLGFLLSSMNSDELISKYIIILSFFIIFAAIVILYPLYIYIEEKFIKIQYDDNKILSSDIEKKLNKDENFEYQRVILSRLTEKEKQIVASLQSGKTYDMIAEEFLISKNTVKYHIKNIYSKYNVGSKAELLKLLS